jgi:hypothetical protein
MKVFRPKQLKTYNKTSITQTREQMIKSLKKRGFTEMYLSKKTDLELTYMINRFTGSNGRRNPSTFKFTGMR